MTPGTDPRDFLQRHRTIDLTNWRLSLNVLPAALVQSVKTTISGKRSSFIPSLQIPAPPVSSGKSSPSWQTITPRSAAVVTAVASAPPAVPMIQVKSRGILRRVITEEETPFKERLATTAIKNRKQAAIQASRERGRRKSRQSLPVGFTVPQQPPPQLLTPPARMVFKNPAASPRTRPSSGIWTAPSTTEPQTNPRSTSPREMLRIANRRPEDLGTNSRHSVSVIHVTPHVPPSVVSPNSPPMRPSSPLPTTPIFHTPFPYLVSTSPSSNGVDPIKSGVDPLKPGVDPLKPGVDPLKPGVDPLKPGVDPLKPGVDPLKPGVDPLKPGVDPLKPRVDPLPPSVDPLKPGVDPLPPSIDPLKPGVDPLPPSINPLKPGVDPLPPSIDPVKPKPGYLSNNESGGLGSGESGGGDPEGGGDDVARDRVARVSTSLPSGTVLALRSKFNKFMEFKSDRRLRASRGVSDFNLATTSSLRYGSNEDPEEEKGDFALLGDVEFVRVFKMTRMQFERLPVWKAESLRRKAGYKV